MPIPSPTDFAHLLNFANFIVGGSRSWVGLEDQRQKNVEIKISEGKGRGDELGMNEFGERLSAELVASVLISTPLSPLRNSNSLTPIFMRLDTLFAGVFVKRDVKKHEIIFEDVTACFGPTDYRKYLLYISTYSKPLVCDILLWAYSFSFSDCPDGEVRILRNILCHSFYLTLLPAQRQKYAWKLAEAA